MNKTQIRKVLCEVKDMERKLIPQGASVIVFVQESDTHGIYTITERIYNMCNQKDELNVFEIQAGSLKEASDKYIPPEGCKEPLVFLFDYGE